jgi:hypothetical protein
MVTCTAKPFSRDVSSPPSYDATLRASFNSFRALALDEDGLRLRISS